MWSIIEPVIAGAVAGLVGYVAFVRIVPRLLVRLSPVGKIVSVVLLGLLTMLVGLNPFATLLAGQDKRGPSTPQETTNEDTSDMGADGPRLSCPGSSVVAESEPKDGKS